jgi:hypothetical protein
LFDVDPQISHIITNRVRCVKSRVPTWTAAEAENLVCRFVRIIFLDHEIESKADVQRKPSFFLCDVYHFKENFKKIIPFTPILRFCGCLSATKTIEGVSPRIMTFSGHGHVGSMLSTPACA